MCFQEGHQNSPLYICPFVEFIASHVLNTSIMIGYPIIIFYVKLNEILKEKNITMKQCTKGRKIKQNDCIIKEI